MSYTDDRDEIADLFGPDKKTDKSYSDELEESIELPEPTKNIEPREDTPSLPPRKKAPEHAVVKSVEVEIPVKKQTPPESKVSDEEFESFVETSDPDFSAEIPAEAPAAEAPAVKKKFKKVPSPPSQEEAKSPTPLNETSPPADSPPKRVGQPPTEQKQEATTAAQNAKVEESPLPDPEKPTRPANNREFLLKTNGLVKIYDGRTVVNGVEINVRPGEIVGLLGPNGAGKTTSFYMIVGLVPPNGGNVTFNNQDVTELPMYQRARLGMGYLPQEESIFRKLTVEENIMAVMETLDLSKNERKARTEELLERFSITHIRNNIALTCSGGEKRRLTIARSLVTNPSLLMLDEPFSGVDPIAVNEIQSIVEDLRQSGLAILITDHNARQTLELVDRAYLIYEGKVLREGSRDFLINDPVSRELYLGDRFTM